MADDSERPIIVKKIKKGGHGHHGGAWKVAYADFVTAMMAFFLMLWLLSSASEEQKKGISEYFMPTIGLKGQMGIGFHGGTYADSTEGTKEGKNREKGVVYGAPSVGATVQMPESVVKDLDEIDAKNFTAMQNDLYKAIHENPELKEYSEQVVIDQIPEGLRVQILDRQKHPMFEEGTANLKPYVKKILKFIAKSIKFLPNYVSIDGHTTSYNSPEHSKWTGSYKDLWDLSSARANSARKFLILDGNLDMEQIARIVGKADQEPITQNITDPKNSRIGILMLKNSILPHQKRSIPHLGE